MVLLNNFHKWGGVTLLLAAFFVFSSEAEAAIKTINISSGGCQYSVDIDYECSPAAQFAMSYSIVEIRKVDPNCVGTLPPFVVPHDIFMQIWNNLDYFIWECTSYYEPCYLGWSKVKAIEYTCWTLWGGVTLTPCADSKECVTITEYCFNGIDVIKGNSTSTGTPATQAECDSLQYCGGSTPFPVSTKCD